VITSPLGKVIEKPYRIKKAYIRQVLEVKKTKNEKKSNSFLLNDFIDIKMEFISFHTG
jgi:hypothetical protein